MCFDSLFVSWILAKKEEREKQDGKNNQTKTLRIYLSTVGHFAFAWFAVSFDANSSKHQINCTSLFYWFQLSGNEIDLHTLTSAHSDTQTHTWLVLKWNSSNENRCLSRNYCFSLSTINLNPMREKRRDVCAPNDFRLPNDFQISVKTICCSFSLLLFVSFRLCDEMFFFPYGPCLVECV